MTYRRFWRHDFTRLISTSASTAIRQVGLKPSMYGRTFKSHVYICMITWAIVYIFCYSQRINLCRYVDKVNFKIIKRLKGLIGCLSVRLHDGKLENFHNQYGNNQKVIIVRNLKILKPYIVSYSSFSNIQNPFSFKRSNIINTLRAHVTMHMCLLQFAKFQTEKNKLGGSQASNDTLVSICNIIHWQLLPFLRCCHVVYMEVKNIESFIVNPCFT